MSSPAISIDMRTMAAASSGSLPCLSATALILASQAESTFSSAACPSMRRGSAAPMTLPGAMYSAREERARKAPADSALKRT